jgi:purine-nucleoside phosphorylase
MLDLNFKYKPLTDYLISEAPFIPEIAVILGSGLGNFASAVETVLTLNTDSLPGYPPSTVEGHKGMIHFSQYENKKLLIFQGRIHFYEGYKISECILPAFISYKLGCKKIIITNAAGGINPSFTPGDLMLINSFIGMNIKRELTDLIGIPTVDAHNLFSTFPSPAMNKKIIAASLEEKIHLKEGVYWYNKGPAYETPAEIKMAAYGGADAVGMSTIPEAVFAAYKELEVASISCITNLAAGLSPVKLSHEEVTVTAKSVSDKFERLTKRIIIYL